MVFGVKELARRESVRCWVLYLAKAVGVLALLFAVSKLLTKMPPIGIAFSWAALSAIAAFSIAYRAVIRKLHKEFRYEKGGNLSRLNNGRVLCLLLSVVLSAACMAALLLESADWVFREWALIVVAVPGYALAFWFFDHRFAKEYYRPFRTQRTVWWSGVIVCFFCCLLYMLINGDGSLSEYADHVEAIAKNSFLVGSESTLLSEAGKLLALSEGFTAFAKAEITKVSYEIYFVWEFALCVSAFYSVTNLLGACVLGMREFRLVFQPLNVARDFKADSPMKKRYVSAACAFVVAVGIAFLGFDCCLAKEYESKRTPIDRFVQSQVGLSLYKDGDSYYTREKVDALLLETEASIETFSLVCEKDLEKLISESFEKREENARDYVRQCRSFSGEINRLAWAFSDSPNRKMAKELSVYIDRDANLENLAEEIHFYLDEAERIEAKFGEGLEACKVTYEVPPWLSVAMQPIDLGLPSEKLALLSDFVDANVEMGLKGSPDMISQRISERVVDDILGKEDGNLTVFDYFEATHGAYLSSEEYEKRIMDAIDESRQEMMAMIGVLGASNS